MTKVKVKYGIVFHHSPLVISRTTEGRAFMSSVIKNLEKHSPLAHKAHIGDKLIAIDGHEIVDVLDYKYYAYDRKMEVTLETPEGISKTFKIKKKELGGDLGIEFDNYLIDKPKPCRNKCLFCFIDQLPKGLRKTLYFKDDDARLSFLTGNYITLTNLSEREMQRIVDLRITPINVSVHATDPILRVKLLGSKSAAEGYERMKFLAEGKITMNCQIVCCPTINDGENLQKSMEDLEKLYPYVNTVAIVPVGLTAHREGLPELRPFLKEEAIETIKLINDFADKCYEKHGARIFCPSDELFLKAEMELPEDEYYEGYTQLENGVGMLRLLTEEFMSALKFSDETPDGKAFSIGTGVAAAPFLKKLLVTAQEKYGKIKGNVFPIVNDFFGHTINVAGLITGGDLINQLKDKELGESLLIPRNMLRDGETVFLDDVTLDEVEEKLNVKVVVVEQDGGDLFDKMMEH